MIKRYPAALLTLPGAADKAKRRRAKGWHIDEQYIVDEKGNVICQWGSYTSRRNAEKICKWSRHDR